MNTVSRRSVLFVHGRGFKPSREPFRDLVRAALRAGIERDFSADVTAFDACHFDVAYYGDLSGEVLGQCGQTYDETLDLADRKNALSMLRKITERKRFGIRQYDTLPGKSALREFVAGTIAPLLGAAGMTMPLIGFISKDFAEYLGRRSDYDSKVRQQIRQKLCALLERGDHVMLLAHGLGCIAVYETLWELSHDPCHLPKGEEFKVDMLVTLGAPLGDMHIRKRLLGARERRDERYPTNIINWKNVSAEDDYVCHDNTLADDFKKMMHRRVVSAVEDFHIYNLAVRYGKSNPHSSVGYLIHPRVSKIVRDWLCEDVLLEEPKYIL